ncbi:MAG: serine hydrolase domain-containing protein [Gaiellaceae bacterium]
MTISAEARGPATAAELGLMEGAPPPAAQHVTLANWQDGPYNRWGFQRVGELVPSAPVRRGDGPVLELPDASEDLDGLVLDGLPGSPTVRRFLLETCTDGFLVLQHGRIRLERYFNGMGPSTLHLLQSVSKSFCGAMTGALVERGLLDLDARVATYVPELWDSAFGEATVAQLLDMTVAVAFNEEYEDPRSDVQAQDRAGGWRPRRPEDPPHSYAFLASLRPSGPHGRSFQYCSATTDALAWTLERASGSRYPALLAEALWSRIGAEYDASITVDAAGFAFANGGLSMTLRDLARFGHLMLQDGAVDGFRATSAAWARRRLDGKPESMGGSEFAVAYPRGSYSTKWWCTGDRQGTFYGTGIYGQFLWIVPSASLVIVKLSSLPRPLDPTVTHNHHLAFRALAAALAEPAE